ncbi:MAG: DUF2219 family protein [Campylobacterota bacterium]|nr:DUF2219 family protein [Campylobacterota bacterium]
MKKFLFVILLNLKILFADSFLLNMGNDFVDDSDGHLTNMIVLSWIFESNDPLYDSLSFELHHSTYTPSDIKIIDKTKFDIPYAGHLYSKVSLYKIYNQLYLHQLGITFGKVGEESYSEELQKVIHDLIGANEPQGWEHQIKGKTTFGLEYDLVQNLPLKEQLHQNIDMNNNLHLSYGTFARKLIATSLIRYGNVLRDDFKSVYSNSTSMIRPNMAKGWSLWGALIYRYIDYIYVLDEYINEYDINNREKEYFSFSTGVDYHKKDSMLSLSIVKTSISKDEKLWHNSWFMITYSRLF